MSEKDWERFFEFLGKIMELPGSWQDKKNAILDHAGDSDLTALEEIGGWFAE